MAVRAKVLEFEASIDAASSLSAEDCPPLVLPPEWQAEHLLLAALLRCSLTSFRHHAQRAGAEARGGGSARGRITKREGDGRYAFVAIEAELDVEVVPAPLDEEVAELVAKAERDCFIGASLTVETAYRWTVNGRAAPA
jgi:organic hydroperoxide reductase OsmC/OhrA